MQRRRRLRGELLPVEKREIGTILVFEHVLAVIDKNARMQARELVILGEAGNDRLRAPENDRIETELDPLARCGPSAPPTYRPKYPSVGFGSRAVVLSGPAW